LLGRNFFITTAKVQKPIRITNVFKAVFYRPYFAKPLLPAVIPCRVNIYSFSMNYCYGRLVLKIAPFSYLPKWSSLLSNTAFVPFCRQEQFSKFRLRFVVR
jgi:hypothetical protein